MAGLLDAIFGHDTQTVEDLREHTGDDPDRAEQAYSAAAGTILRGVEQTSQTKEGAENILDMIKKQIEKGNVKTDSDPNSGVQVRDMNQDELSKMMHTIFGDKAPDVQGAFGKVITMDPETSKKVFAKVMPAVLGQIFGATEQHPDENPRALPKVVSDARQQMERQQPRSAGIFDAILDQDHDGDVDLNDLVGLLGRRPK
jgi:hypothetical protein